MKRSSSIIGGFSQYRKGNYWFAVCFLFFLCFFTRLYFAGKYLDCRDSVNFAFGLHDYDLSSFQPHFPGYPVYIYISRIFYKLFHNEVLALVLPGVVFGSFTLFPLFLLTKELFHEKIAFITAILYIINPLCWFQAERPASDTLGLFFIILSSCILFRVFRQLSIQKIRACVSYPTGSEVSKPYLLPNGKRHFFLGSLILGIGLGVRLSYFPFMFLWLGILYYIHKNKMHYRKRFIFSGFGGFIFGVLLWLFPQCAYIGWQNILYNGFTFSIGHFTDWGGSIYSYSGLERIVSFIKSIGLYGLGFWWYGCSVLRFIPTLILFFLFFFTLKNIFQKNKYLIHLISFRRNAIQKYSCTTFFRSPQMQKKVKKRLLLLGKHTRVLFFCLYIFPYLCWIFFGQNVANPRHMLPVIPIFLMCIAYGLYQLSVIWHKRVALLVSFAFLTSITVTSLALILQYHKSIPVQITLLEYIQENYQQNSTRIYCREEKRFFDYYAPKWDVKKIQDMKGVMVDLKSSLHVPQNILVFNMVEKGELHDWKCKTIWIFRENYHTDDKNKGLMLYQWKDVEGH